MAGRGGTTVKFRLPQDLEKVKSHITNVSINFLKQTKKAYDAELERIANGAYERMVAVLNRAKHGTGNLAGLLKPKFIVTDEYVQFKIGNFTELNNEAPYWYVLNYGATVTNKKFIPPPNYGHFGGQPPDKTKAGNQELWTHTGDKGDFYMKPKTFTPLPYLRAAEEYISREMRKLNKKLVRK